MKPKQEPISIDQRKVWVFNVVFVLFPKMMRLLLQSFITPRGLLIKYNNGDIKVALTDTEKSEMEKLPKMTEFTTELCYKILRFEKLVPKPSSQWEVPPDKDHQEITDDIKRIVFNTNDVLHKLGEDTSNTCFETFKGRVEEIVARIDSYLNIESCKQWYEEDIPLETDLDRCITELQNMREIDFTSKLTPSLSDMEIENGERFARIGWVIIDVFPKILRAVIQMKIAADVMYKHCSTPPNWGRFSYDEQNKLKSMNSSNTYDLLDIPLVYRLLRQFSLIPEPANTWGQQPSSSHTSTGDDIERIRFLRNDFAHRSNINTTQSEFDDTFSKFKDICRRMDVYFKNDRASGYENDVSRKETTPMDNQLRQKYQRSLQELENIKLRFIEPPVKFYWGEAVELSLKNLRQVYKDEKDKRKDVTDEKLCLQIVGQNIDDESVISRLIDEEFKDEINNGLTSIQLKNVSKSSIILHVGIRKEAVCSEETFRLILVQFVYKILQTGHVRLPTSDNVDVVLVQEDGETSLDHPVFVKTEIGEETPETGSDFKQNIHDSMSLTPAIIRDPGRLHKSDLQTHVADQKDSTSIHRVKMETSDEEKYVQTNVADRTYSTSFHRVKMETSNEEKYDKIFVDVNNLKCLLEIKGLPNDLYQSEREEMPPDVKDTELLYIEWTLACPSKWNASLISSNIQDNPHAFHDEFSIEFVYNESSRLIIHTTAQRCVFRSYSSLEVAVKNLLAKILNVSNITTTEPAELSASVLIMTKPEEGLEKALTKREKEAIVEYDSDCVSPNSPAEMYTINEEYDSDYVSPNSPAEMNTINEEYDSDYVSPNSPAEMYTINEAIIMPAKNPANTMQQSMGSQQGIMSTSIQSPQQGNQQSGSQQPIQAGIDPGNLPIIPNPPIQGQNKDRIIIWSGILEYQEKMKTNGPTQTKMARQLQCQLSIGSADPEIITTNWPKELKMQLVPQSLLSSPQLQQVFKSSRQVAFHFGNNNVDSLRNLHRIMGSGFAGCVPFYPGTHCDVLVLLLLWSNKKKAFLGLIPNDQKTFADGMRSVILAYKQKQQKIQEAKLPEKRKQQQLLEPEPKKRKTAITSDIAKAKDSHLKARCDLMSQNQQDVGSWFHKLVINCDGQMVNIDSCNRKHICSNNIKGLNGIKSKGPKDMSMHLHSILGNKEKEYEILLVFSSLLKVKNIKPDDWLLKIIEYQHTMACYMLLAYLSGTETEKKDVILPALRMAITKDDPNITNIISWFIIKEYLRSVSFKNDCLLDIWPAVVCNQSNCYTSAFCSKELVIVVDTTQLVENLPITFWDLEVKYLSHTSGEKIRKQENYGSCNKENLIASAECSFTEKFEINGNLASELFKKHRKLTLICKSMYKTKDGVKIEKPCIQLFCRGKGLIPVKENHFPKFIKNVETDILEGEPVFSRNIRVGDQINSEKYIGTLGGFVKVLGDVTFLTCAHVVLPNDCLDGLHLTMQSNEAIHIDCVQTSPTQANSPTSTNLQTKFRCGKLRYIQFKADKPGETSIDAALIELQHGIYIDNDDFIANIKNNKHHFQFLGMRSPFLNENWLDHDKMFYGRHFRQFDHVTVGAVSNITVNRTSTICVREDKEEGIHVDRETVMDTYNRIRKSENQTSAHSSTFSSTAPVFSNDAHLQETRLKKVDKERTFRRLSRCMFNQITVTHIPFKPGDSGTCIYVCDNSLEKYGCIGMAIANHPDVDGGVIVTPMKEILKSFPVKI